MSEEMRTGEITARYRDAVNTSVALFRQGKDHGGLDALLHSIEDLECLLNQYQCTGDASLPVDAILPVYRQLLECMQNQDITGMADLLEYTICPLSTVLPGRCEEICE